LAHKPWIVPIPGTTKLHRLEENIGGAGVALTAQNLHDLAQVLDEVHLQRERSPDQMQQLVNR
jgi:aryl-alcohol dehydrogenase-like predicted oxidoreductase